MPLKLKKYWIVVISILLITISAACQAKSPEQPLTEGVQPASPVVQILSPKIENPVLAAEGSLEQEKQTMTVGNQSITVWGLDVVEENGTEYFTMMVSYEHPPLTDWIFQDTNLTVGGKEMMIDSGYPIENYTLSATDGKMYRLTFQNGADAPVWELVNDPQQKFVRTDRIFFRPIDESIKLYESGASASLSIGSLFSMPREGEECEPEFIARAEERLSEFQPGIKLACSSNEFGQEIVVADSPAGVDAQKLISEVFPNGILTDIRKLTGPWVFELKTKE